MDYSDMLINQQAVLRKDATKQQIADYWDACRKADKYPFKAMDLLPWEQEFTPLIPRKDIRVQLSRFEISVCLRIGPERTLAARRAGMQNMIYCDEPLSPRERFIEQNGLAGEWAKAKLLNIFPTDQVIVQARHVHQDYGDHIFEGRVIDTKTTEYPYGTLPLAIHKNKDTFFDRVQVMSLMTGDIRPLEEARSGNGPRGSYVWRGFMSSRDLAQPRRLGFLPGRENRQYIAKQYELTERLHDWPSKTTWI
jgi:hypothetical protein